MVLLFRMFILTLKKGFYYSKIDLRFDLEKGGKYIGKKSWGLKNIVNFFFAFLAFILEILFLKNIFRIFKVIFELFGTSYKK